MLDGAAGLGWKMETRVPRLGDRDGLLVSVLVVEMLIWVVITLVRVTTMSVSVVMMLVSVVTVLVSEVEGTDGVSLAGSVGAVVSGIGTDDDGSNVGWGNPGKVETTVVRLVTEVCGTGDDGSVELGMNVFEVGELGGDVFWFPFPLPLPLPRPGNSESSLSSSSRESSSSLLSTIMSGDIMRGGDRGPLRVNVRLIVSSLLEPES